MRAVGPVCPCFLVVWRALPHQPVSIYIPRVTQLSDWRRYLDPSPTQGWPDCVDRMVDIVMDGSEQYCSRTAALHLLCGALAADPEGPHSSWAQRSVSHIHTPVLCRLHGRGWQVWR